MQQPMQPVTQHDQQLAAQQMQQQMVLCPVRVVYETQILVQPGEQIQPNQTLFINPQNPPPWAQSRPVQNPVYYVQQMPGNIMSSLPQHIDQNQLYLHQYPNYQQGVQVIPQQMMQNLQENRANAIQMSNLMQQNIISNFQANMAQNVGQNMQTLPDRTMQQALHQNVGTNMPIQGQIHPNIAANLQLQAQAQLNLANNAVINRANDSIGTVQNQTQQTQQQTQYAEQKAETKQTYTNVGQLTQPPNVARPQAQILTVNPIQSIPQTTNMQTFAPIVRPTKTENVASQITQPTYVNASQNTHITRIRKISPNTTNKIVPNQNIGIRGIGQTQTYRPIQPRPHQYRPNIPNLPNYTTIEAQSPGNSMPLLNQNVINITSNTPVQMNTNAMSFIKTDDQSSNRKRKSESPDEIHKKMATIQVNITTPMRQTNDVPKRSAEIGINTISYKHQMPITKSLLESNVKLNVMAYNEMITAEAKLFPNQIQIVPNTMKFDNNNAVGLSLDPIETSNNSLQKEAMQNALTDEKLIRNTVFTQARGRVLTDKESVTISQDIPLLESVNNLKEITLTPKDPSIVADDKVKLEPNQTIEVIKNEVVGAIKDETFIGTKDLKKEIKNEKVKEEKRKPPDMNVSLNTTNNKGMFPMERSVKQERDYILTHVLDGIVIQESNVAFPIREPLIKRISQAKPQISKEVQDSKSKVKNSKVKDEESKVKVEDSKVKVEDSKVKVKDCKVVVENIRIVKDTDQRVEEASEGGSKGDNPFSSLSPATVKSWTTQDLSSYLTSHGWEDTASLFVDHEIDGESLYLVSKAQLQNIGVSDEHAEFICAFVKS